jgi:metal-responsive CopG/Arc/MetJ family transcriptional regulator
MKTAISVPNDLFESADQLARQLGITRSQLYVNALREYVATRRHQGLTEQINAVCDKLDTSLAPDSRKAQANILLREAW